MKKKEFDELRIAEEMAVKYHSGQKMKSGDTPYIVHCYRVLLETINALSKRPELGMRLATICAMLHDTIEDTKITEDEIAETFGQEVLAGVKALTKNRDLPKEKQIANSLERIVTLGVDEIKIVKMCDRIVNLDSPPQSWSREKISSYRDESREIHRMLGHSDTDTANRLMEKIESYKKYIDKES